MGNYSKNPSYESDSQEVVEEVSSFQKKALKIFEDNIEDAAHCVVDIFTSLSESFQDPVSKRLKLDASKYALKICGLEVDRTEHSGAIKFEPVKFFTEEESDSE